LTFQALVNNQFVFEQETVVHLVPTFLILIGS